MLDLDPMPGVPFATVVDVARWVRDALDGFGITGYPKTSGKTGLHVYVPRRRGTSYEASRLFAEIVAPVVAQRHPRVATIERPLRDRGRRVYVGDLWGAFRRARGVDLSAVISGTPASGRTPPRRPPALRSAR